MKTRQAVRLTALLALTQLLQGCLVFPYTTTPKVSGRVLDAETKAPIAGAHVGFRDRSRAHTLSGADGRFALLPGHNWGPAFIIPFEFTPCGGVLTVDADGYIPFERDFGSRTYRPVELPDVLLVHAREKDTPNQVPEPTPTTVTPAATHPSRQP